MKIEEAKKLGIVDADEFSDLAVRAVALEAAAMSWSGGRSLYAEDDRVIETAKRYEAYLREGK